MQNFSLPASKLRKGFEETVGHTPSQTQTMCQKIWFFNPLPPACGDNIFDEGSSGLAVKTLGCRDMVSNINTSWPCIFTTTLLKNCLISNNNLKWLLLQQISFSYSQFHFLSSFLSHLGKSRLFKQYSLPCLSKFSLTFAYGLYLSLTFIFLR